MEIASYEIDIKESLAHLFQEVDHAVADKFATEGVPVLMEVSRQVVTEVSRNGWSADERVSRENVLRVFREMGYDGFPDQLPGRPWLDKKYTALFMGCAEKLIEYATIKDNSFWWGFTDGSTYLIDGPWPFKSSYHYNDDPHEWIIRILLLPSLWDHLSRLEALGTSSDADARTFAEEVMAVVNSTEREWSVSMPLFGITITSENISCGGIVLRRLSGIEQAKIAAEAQQGGSSLLSVRLPTVALEAGRF